jgi:hypothetical protein
LSGRDRAAHIAVAALQAVYAERGLAVVEA